MNKRAIAVFDSGFGGISVLAQLKKDFPYENFIYFGDSKYAPYGVKSKQEIFERCKVILESFVVEDIKAVVIACNTATSACAKELRELYPNLIIIGMEPAVKPALKALDEDKKFIVLATEFTLKQSKFNELVHNLNGEEDMIAIPGPELVEIVEHAQLDDKAKIDQVFQTYFRDIDLDQIDSIVLGCTHFVFYKQYLIDNYPNIHIIDSSEGTSSYLRKQLEAQSLLENSGTQSIVINNSRGIDEVEYSKYLLNYIDEMMKEIDA